MKRVKLFEDFVHETIRAEEAFRDETAIQSVIDGKRDVGFVTIKASTLPAAMIWAMINDNGLKTLKVRGNEYEAYIYFKKGADKKAKELKDIAERYGGYFAWNASEKDSRRIGELLGYDKRDIDAYINKHYK